LKIRATYSFHCQQDLKFDAILVFFLSLISTVCKTLQSYINSFANLQVLDDPFGREDCERQYSMQTLASRPWGWDWNISEMIVILYTALFACLPKAMFSKIIFSIWISHCWNH